MRDLVVTYNRMVEARGSMGKTYQISVPETDVSKMMKYMKDAEHSYEVGVKGNRRVFEISVIDTEELEIILNDLKSLNIRYKVE
jgi:hypothetical protein